MYLRKTSSGHRPASAASRASTTSGGYEASRPPVSLPSPNPRSSKHATNKGERHQSLPAGHAAAPPVDVCEAAALTEKSSYFSLSARSSYERRRGSGIMSPPISANSARSIHSDRGHDRTRTRNPGTGGDEIISVHRLRSNSGLSLHTNSAALRRYTDYNADGSSRLSPTDERVHAATRPERQAHDSKPVSPSADGPDDTHTASGVFSRETMRAVLTDSAARQQLWEYTHSRAGAESLDDLFGTASAHVEDRIVRDVYPGFVKRQLALRIKDSLGATSASAAQTPFRFGGLGQAFCLTDPYRPDNPIVFASDSFAHTMGYAKSEDLPRSGSILRLPGNHHEDAVMEDLVLSSRHRRDNQPFWSLVSVCPLKSASGRVRFLLCGLVDVSSAVNTQADILHALAAVSPNSALSPVTDRASVADTAERSPTFDNSTPRLQPLRADKGSSTKSFFNPFSRKRRTDGNDRPPSQAESRPLPLRCVSPLPSAIGAAVTRPATAQTGSDLPVYSRFMVLQYVPGSNHGSDSMAAAQPPGSRRGSRQGSTAPSTGNSPSPISRLKVAFSSLPMLELLGLGPAAHEAILYHDVFAVLSELAGSPSISPIFRANVRQHIVCSETASLELYVPASGGPPAPGVFSAGLGFGLALPATHATINSDETDAGGVPRRTSMFAGGRSKGDRDEGSRPLAGDKPASDGWWTAASGGRRRKSGTYERPPTSDRKVRELPRMQRLMSHWTPLKDSDGSFAWVVLVMSPVTER
ncbi:hypothetical protein SPI_01098 [Niveomyces insectorum RCEF 264]|uniref:PAS domain-containing protein n=1 Tax=Niveomyces insectorum RCEF 264 TaxID=1081102 RepID=A0A162JBG2_9HYPO|nr:hypothetical protein SPI_01098 [Niveomyces insectorum RCEF 264]